MCYRYVDRNGLYADELEPYLPKLTKDETVKFNSKNYPLWVEDMMTILAKAGRDDPIMHQVQDEVFNEKYWNPAHQHCIDMQLKTPLSWCLVYDTCIHSGPGKVTELRKLFPESPPSRGGEEKAWSRAFANARHKWLATYVGSTEAHSRVVRGSARRVTKLIDLMGQDNWRLEMPFTIGEPYNVTIEDTTKAKIA
jgi:chitosanase